MLSRRNIRIKVLQTLYAANRDKGITPQSAAQLYHKHIEQSFALYIFNLLQLREITKYAVQDETNRKSKHLPSDEDKKFSTKLYNNELIQATLDNEVLKSLINSTNSKAFLNEDNTRLLYADLLKTPEYKAYLDNPNCTNEDHREILLFLFKYSVTGEIYNELMDDYFLNWWDDKSLVIGAIKKSIKAMPFDGAYIDAMRPNYETIKEFGESLLLDVINNNENLLATIEPALNNWDADRVAVIDMIILKMALSELLNFPTIPTKVTLNEFVEIAKLYSTDKSKDFINGILDRLFKKLDKEGKIKKEGRGLVE